MILKPVDFTPSRKYPVIMSQYSGRFAGGPQQVANGLGLLLWLSQGYIVIKCRRTRYRRVEARHQAMSYRNLGHYETIDQVNAARYAANLPYVDGSRIGIYGWSYGGYEALMAASRIR